MDFDGGDQQVDVVGAACVDLVIDDDLVFGLLQFDELAELGFGLPALPLRITSVDGSNRLTSLSGLRLSPPKMRALVCCITWRTREIIASSV